MAKKPTAGSGTKKTNPETEIQGKIDALKNAYVNSIDNTGVSKFIAEADQHIKFLKANGKVPLQITEAYDFIVNAVNKEDTFEHNINHVRTLYVAFSNMLESQLRDYQLNVEFETQK